jgi:site-specific recombinase XerC
MGRPRAGWRLRPPKGKRTKYAVVFTWGGCEVERSCGTTDQDVAATVAARIYAAYIARNPDGREARERRARSTHQRSLWGLVSEWLTAHASVADAGTVGLYSLYWETHLEPFFERIENITEITAQEYRNHRLTKVQAVTVRKELSALRGFIAWASERGHMREVMVAGVPKRSLGTKHENTEDGRRMRGAAVELSPAEAEALIAELPEWTLATRTNQRFPVRARFQLGYEMGLRPSTLDGLEIPRHWSPGKGRLLITSDIDKVGWERSLKLTKRAYIALESVADQLEPPCPIFGRHNYRRQLQRAAAEVLKRGGFAGGHMRHNRITHLLEQTGNMPGVQFIAGHKNTSTTSRYVKPSERAGDDVIGQVAKIDD